MTARTKSAAACLEDLITAAEKWAAVRERNAASCARNGMIGPRMIEAEKRAYERYAAAEAAAREVVARE